MTVEKEAPPLQKFIVINNDNHEALLNSTDSTSSCNKNSEERYYIGPAHHCCCIHDNKNNSKIVPSPSKVINESSTKTGCSIEIGMEEEFDAAWWDEMKRKFQNAGVMNELNEFLDTNQSNGRRLKLQVMAFPPGMFFKLHTHPNIEFEFTLFGSLHEFRWLTFRAPAHDLKGQQEQEEQQQQQQGEGGRETHDKSPPPPLSGPDISAAYPFEHISVCQGETLVNEIGSVHQSFTSTEEGCVLLILWSGCHVYTHPSRIFNTDPRLRPTVGWD